MKSDVPEPEPAAPWRPPLVNSPLHSENIVRRSLHHEVVEKLRELILSGELEPRSRVNEMALCERFGISRTPLREAIKLLSAEGLLELLPNRGARVAALTDAEIDEILEVVGALEATGGELACERITEDELQMIEVATCAMIEAWRVKDYHTYFALNKQIHDAMIAAAGNNTLRGTYFSLSGRVQRARYTAHKTEEQWARAIDDHNLMVILLRRRDGVALAKLMRDHIRSKRAIISAAFSAPAKPKRVNPPMSPANST
ncbi:MAG: GntR family transcriptional regulator [Ancalomicrobiaceae bacterium]|nr:GntR family transcriptional regulator [Ancalomicrobiaceae bacterium]